MLGARSWVSDGSTACRPVLNYRNNQGYWNVDPALLDTPLQQVCESETAITPANPFSCPHELWLALDLDDESWMAYSKFTLRLSWPASVRFFFVQSKAPIRNG